MDEKIPLTIPKSVLRVAFAVVLASFTPMLYSTMLNIALKDLMVSLQTTLAMVQWGVTGYTLALTVAVPISGWLLDHFNARRIAILATLLFGLFSLASGLAWDINSFISFRILQGFTAGLSTTVGMSILMRVAPSQVLGRLMAIITIPMIFGPIIGPVIAGLLLQMASWRWIFFFGVILILVTIPVIIRFIPDFTPFNPDNRLDLVGIGLLAIAAASLIFGLVQGANGTTFFNVRLIGFGGFGLILFLVYGWWDHNQQGHTVLPLRFFKSQHFSAAMAGMFLSAIVMNGPLLVLPLFFENVRGFTPTQAALILISQGAGMLLARPIVGRIIDTIGSRLVTMVSLMITLIGSLPFVFTTARTNLIWLVLVLFIRGIGVSGIQLPMMTDIFLEMGPQDIPAASVGNQMIQNVGSSFGTAMMTAVIALETTTRSKISESVATLHGYQLAFLASCIVIGVMVLPAIFLSHRSRN